jgi:threonyl-tRNA synthetase
MKVNVDNKEIEIQEKSSVFDLSLKLNLTQPEQSITAKVNGVLVDLSCKLFPGDQIQILSFDDAEGKDVFWHSSAHVLAQAVLRLYPETLATIGPSIEHGFYYDFANLTISDQDFPLIEKEVKKIIKENHKPERTEFANKQEAINSFLNNPYKKELINSFDQEPISAYKQGEFIDLCRGPHLLNLGKIKSFKILKTSGAYWRGNQEREMLTRIYGISFPNKKLLADYLKLLEESKKRDHKLLGQQLDLFSLKEEAPGIPFIHPKGMIVWENLVGFLREKLQKANYIEIKTPPLMTKELWVKSGHWSHYKEHMYVSEVEDREFAIKPMNCPGCMLFYKSQTHSYREFPLRIAEIGQVARFEPSGSLNGLFRVRSFHQDDAHVFMKKENIKTEILEILSFADDLYMTFGLSFRLELSTRPEKEKTIGSDEDWETATNGLKDALDEWGHSYTINEGDGAFYGPKIDIHIRDALGRFWQCATIQLDMSLPEKFDLEYVDSDGKHKRPIMLHRAIFGSIERFFGILIEHFAGKFPLWLSPIGVRIICVADRHQNYANEVKDQIEKQNIRCDIDSANESVSKKIRNAQLLKINYMITVGDKEDQNKSISLRIRDASIIKEMKVNDFVEKVVEEKNKKSLMSVFVTNGE